MPYPFADKSCFPKLFLVRVIQIVLCLLYRGEACAQRGMGTDSNKNNCHPASLTTPGFLSLSEEGELEQD